MLRDSLLMGAAVGLASNGRVGAANRSIEEGVEVVSSKGAVAVNPIEAARVGARILESGGNAMDAASATSIACCMLRPHATGVGGYVACAVVLEGKTGRVWSVDANSIAPAAAHEHMFEVLPLLDQGAADANTREYFCRVKDDANMFGPLAVGPPGMMAGMGIVWERWGRLKWPDIVAPSLQLLADGFPFGPVVGSIRSREKYIRMFPPSVEHLMPGGKVPSPNDIWHRPDMDKTLERISKAGWRDFYEGEIGHKIADYIQKTGGILTREDMAQYEPRVTNPYTITYRNATVHGPILTNGCLSSLQILNMLECLDGPCDDSPEYFHRLLEVYKLAWRDRLRYLADPEFVEVPAERLLSKDYAAGRVERINRFPERVDKLVPPIPGEPPHGTVHVSTADAEGNAVAMTISQGGGLGSCVVVPGTGIVLGHGMFRFDPRPGQRNSVAPRKRMLNNTACMMVRMPDRDVAIGLPGGRRIISVMPRAVQMLVDHGATGREAATAPRAHVEMSEPALVQKTAGEGVISALRAMGHDVLPARGIAGCMNCAEVLKHDRTVRAGSNQSAVGV